MSKILDNIKEIVDKSDAIIIGAGSGLSTASGIDYAGEEFKEKFAPFIKKYSFTDLYTSSFYEFKTKEEYWAYWAMHINFANTGREGTKLYKDIYNLVKEKEYFVITTNVDDQFYKTGFDENKIFRVQGSYAFLQCLNACHDKLYPSKEIVDEMIKNIDEDLKIPTTLVPKCPVCGGDMEPNLRKDSNFVEDDLWYKQQNAYDDFLEKNKDKKVILLEFGVGFNTPGIIRFPFEQMTLKKHNFKLIRFNKDCRCLYNLDNDRFIEITEDLNNIFNESRE